MFLKVWPVAAVVAAMASAVSVQAQSVSSVGGPRELPPAGYTQQQYVDSRGCVFLRAGLGGAVRWVPRVGRDKKAMCGATPTFASARAASAALDVGDDAAAPATTAMSAPTAPAPAATARVPITPAPAARTAAVAPPLPSPITAPAKPAAPLRTAPAQTAALPANGVPAGRVGCFASAPVLQRVALSNGGTALVCTRGDGTLDGWRSPVFAANAPVGAALSGPERPARPAPETTVAATTPPAATITAAAPQPIPSGTRLSTGLPVPAGYVAAWKDDRLNPMRGIGTAEGQAQQDMVWTRKVPAKAVTTRSNRVVIYTADQAAPATSALSMSAKNDATTSAPSPQTPSAQAASYIQVGAFGDPANAQRAIARLAAAGLPVASQSGSGLKVVLAGPFASAAQAQGALGTARSAGFSDAFVR